MDNLKPCPFCGGDAEYMRFGDKRNSCVIRCTECSCELETGEEGDLCGTQWNNRPQEQKLIKIVELLSQALEQVQKDLDVPSVSMEEGIWTATQTSKDALRKIGEINNDQ